MPGWTKKEDEIPVSGSVGKHSLRLEELVSIGQQGSTTDNGVPWQSGYSLGSLLYTFSLEGCGSLAGNLT